MVEHERCVAAVDGKRQFAIGYLSAVVFVTVFNRRDCGQMPTA